MRAFCQPVRALVVAIGLVVLMMAGGNAQGLDAALSGFTTDTYSDVEEAINAVAASGAPRALEIIQALQDGRLLFDLTSKQVFIRDQAGRLVDAANGLAAVSVNDADLKPVRLNNRLRRAVEAALGALNLLASGPQKRFAAAQAVFKSREAAALPTLETALAKESDRTVKKALAEARAAIVLNLSTATEADKLAAVSTIRSRGDQDALALLADLPPDSPEAVTRAAKAGIVSIQQQLAMWDALQNAWYGLSLGSVLLLAAIGLAVTFGVMGVINMAHGEMVMLGAYTTFVVQQIIRDHDPALFDLSLAMAIPLAFAVAGFVGILIERGIIRFL
jgi:urea transport system permease protein